MNYRHGYHAGNFADLAKHAALMQLLLIVRQGAPMLVVDTHAGAGDYDLSDATFSRSKEAEAGIKSLMAEAGDVALNPLRDYVRAKNKAKGFVDTVGYYPGSPVLINDHLRLEDDYLGCELREDDYRRLRDAINSRGRILRTDGYAEAIKACSNEKELFFLIDPPFEQFEDYDDTVSVLFKILEQRPSARAMVWLPIKDIETLDRFVRLLETAFDQLDQAQRPHGLMAEMRLRSLWTPMKLNGCALLSLNPPLGFSDALEAIAKAVVARFGDQDGLAKLWTI